MIIFSLNFQKMVPMPADVATALFLNSSAPILEVCSGLEINRRHGLPSGCSPIPLYSPICIKVALYA